MPNLILSLCLSLLASMSTPVVSPGEVLAMMAIVPASEHIEREASKEDGHYDRQGDALEVAGAIATLARSREDASRLVVFGAWESRNQKCAKGDGGKSWGFLQLGGVSRYVACTPMLAIGAWHTKAEASEKACAGNMPDERLAALASGHCNRGLGKVRHRVQVARIVDARALWGF
jgi:hypothetical protein